MPVTSSCSRRLWIERKLSAPPGSYYAGWPLNERTPRWVGNPNVGRDQLEGVPRLARPVASPDRLAYGQARNTRERPKQRDLHGDGPHD